MFEPLHGPTPLHEQAVGTSVYGAIVQLIYIACLQLVRVVESGHYAACSRDTSSAPATLVASMTRPSLTRNINRQTRPSIVLITQLDYVTL